MWQDLKNIYHLFQAVAANTLYGFPAKDLIVIGVTGTDGKTTTANLIYHILKKAGHKTAIVSTVSAIINDKEYDTGFHRTTPDFFAIQSYLKKAKEAGSEYIVLEVTSHALDQHRVWGIPFTVGVLTNVTHEHLDYHGSYEEYLRTKLKLLRASEIGIINRDDESFRQMANGKWQMAKTVTYGLDISSDVNPKSFQFKTALPGDYNTYNILAAVAVCQALGIQDEKIRAGIADFKLPTGRAEVVYDKEFTVMIDFAHTPNSLKQVLQSIKNSLPEGKRIIHVFGSAGERDKSKRPEMGHVSSQFADAIILTSEDPRSESPEKIMSEIAEGIDKTKYKSILYKAADRQEAIAQAISMAGKGEYVLITGKGHEQSMNMGHNEEPWSEHDAVQKALRFKFSSNN